MRNWNILNLIFYCLYNLVFAALLLKHVSAEACPQASSKTAVFTIGSICYEVIEDPATQVMFASAQQDCESRGGNLVTIKDNQTESKLLVNLRQMSDSHTVLLGLRKSGEQWKWVTGENLDYSSWAPDTPCADCECAKLNLATDGRWQKFQCQTSDWFTIYVCEYDPSRSSAGSNPAYGVVSLLVAGLFTALTWSRRL